MLLVVLAVDLLLILAGVAMVLRPGAVNALENRIFCALRLKKREISDRSIPRWRNIATIIVGILIIAFVIYDCAGLRVCITNDVVSTVTSGTLAATSAKKVDNLVMPKIKSGQHIGVVVGIVEGGRIWTRGYGRKTTTSDDPPDGESIFEIGSVTKTFTCTSLAVMSERNDVRLSDPVGIYLPASVQVPRYGSREITLEDLAMHTSGLPRVPDNMGFISNFSDDPYADYRDEELYEFLKSHKLRRSPGTEHEYSNLGMGLLGLALCRKANVGYELMVTRLVCEPLGMHDTSVKLSDSQRADLVPGYALQQRMGQVLIAVPSGNWIFQDCTAGAGALKSSANDMLKYLQANIEATRSSWPALLTAQTSRFKIDDVQSIGLGWFMLNCPWVDEPVIWHNGGTGGYCSFVGFCKKRGVGVVVLANSSTDVDIMALRILKMMIQDGKP